MGPLTATREGGSPPRKAESRPDLSLTVGRVVDGKYRVDSVLGEGGMGIVYDASHVALGRRVALKVLRPGLASEPEQVERFKQEARAASAIGSDHIVDVTDSGTLDDGSIYFVMQYLEGSQLSAVLARDGSLTVSRALDVASQICEALEAAHLRGIVHRDLKPDNVFLVRRGAREDFVKVVDFGVAKVLGSAGTVTRTGVLLGTPYYMSPEQAAGRKVDHRTDVYALGVMLFEMLTGRVPFESESFMGVISQHLFDPPPRLADVWALGDEWPDLEHAVAKALAKGPDERFESMGAFRAALLAIPTAGRREAGATGIETHARRRGEVGSSTEPPGARLGHRRPSPRVLLFSAIAVVVLLGVGLAATFIDAGKRPSTAVPIFGPLSAIPVAPFPGPPRSAQAPDLARTEPERPKTVEIRSSPPGAEVVEGETVLGRTPVAVTPPPEGARRLVVRARGYESIEVRVSRDSDVAMSVTLRRVAQRAAQPRQKQGRADRISDSEIRDPFVDTP